MSTEFSHEPENVNLPLHSASPAFTVLVFGNMPCKANLHYLRWMVNPGKAENYCGTPMRAGEETGDAPVSGLGAISGREMTAVSLGKGR